MFFVFFFEYFLTVVVSFVVTISAVSCLKTLVSITTYYVSSGTSNRADSLLVPT